MAQKTNIIKRRPQTKKTRKKHTGLIVAIIIAVVVIITAGAIIFLNREKIFPSTQSEEKTSVEKGTDSKEKKSTSGSEEEENTGSGEEGTSSTRDGSNREEGKESIAQYEGKDPNGFQEVTGNINFAGISEGLFIVSATVDQELGNSGLCKFTITHSSGAATTASANTSAGPSTSFCEYSTTAANLSSGHYDITIEISAEGKKGTISGGVSI